MRSILAGVALLALVVWAPSSAWAGGALAVGDCGSDGATPYGITANYPSQVEAGRAALRYCADTTCKVVVVVTGFCIAFALDRRDCGAQGHGYGPSEREAQSFALQYCSKYGGKECHVVVTRCDSDYYVPPSPPTFKPFTPSPTPTPTPSPPVRVCPPNTQRGLGGCYGY